MGRKKKLSGMLVAARLPQCLTVAEGHSDYEVEADDGCDLVERILEAKHFGRDAFLEVDVDYW